MHDATALRQHSDTWSGRGFTRSKGPARRRRSRSVSGGLEIAALVVIAALLILGAIVTSPHSAPAPALATLKVRAGDSLWTLAATHPIDGLTTRQVSELLVEANDLEGPLVIPGQTILVPVESPDQRLAAR